MVLSLNFSLAWIGDQSSDTIPCQAMLGAKWCS